MESDLIVNIDSDNSLSSSVILCAKPYLNQPWIMIMDPREEIVRTFEIHWNAIFQANLFEDVIYKRLDILFKPQWYSVRLQDLHC